MLDDLNRLGAAPRVSRHAATAAAGLTVLVLAGCGGPGRSPALASPASVAPAGEGATLSASEGCRACHSIDGSPGVGPTWKGLAGSRVRLSTGETLTATDAYLRTSIEDPDHQIVAGYARGVMSGTIPRGSISARDADALVAYIKSLR